MKNVYLIRHGETDSNLHHYVPNKLEPLNARGLTQAEELAERVAHLDIDQLVSSDFLRAQQTIQPIAVAKNLPVITVSAFGEVLEPTSIHNVPEAEEAVVLHRKNRNANVENPDWRQEDGENFSDMFARVQLAKQFLEESTSSNILVTSHSFFLMLFVSAILLKPKKATFDWHTVASGLKVSNTGITLLTEENKKWDVVTWNDHAHFAE
jgi:broad specificity phosphatase PhoE